MPEKVELTTGTSDEAMALIEQINDVVEGALLGDAMQALGAALCVSLHAVGHVGENAQTRVWIETLKAKLDEAYASGVECPDKANELVRSVMGRIVGGDS